MKNETSDTFLECITQNDTSGEKVQITYYGEILAREIIAFLKADAAAFIAKPNLDENAKARLIWDLRQINRIEDNFIRILQSFANQGFPDISDKAMVYLYDMIHIAYSIGNNRWPNKENMAYSARVNSKVARRYKTKAKNYRIEAARPFIKLARRDVRNRIINMDQLCKKVSKSLKMQKCISTKTMSRYVAEVDREG